jgi:hypothetical protein
MLKTYKQQNNGKKYKLESAKSDLMSLLRGSPNQVISPGCKQKTVLFIETKSKYEVAYGLD